MMELADMRDLGSRAGRHAGSTPVTRMASERVSTVPFPSVRRKLHYTYSFFLFRIEPAAPGFDLVFHSVYSVIRKIVRAKVNDVWVERKEHNVRLYAVDIVLHRDVFKIARINRIDIPECG